MSAIEELTALLGADTVTSAPEDLDARSGDWSPRHLLERRAGRAPARPLCVVRPASEEEVAAVLRWAHETRTPVVPFGGGSGVVEGIRPGGAVVVDLGRMDLVLDVDDKSLLARAQAGVRGPALAEALAASGLRLGHEPQSMSISTVGGWVATRACGQLSARHGGIENLVAGLRAVLPGGRVVASGAAPRRSTGPDVASLMIGSEGALGIVTEVTLRVSPVPAQRAGSAVGFEHMAEGVAACRRLAQGELAPSVVRLYDAEDAAILTLSGPRRIDHPVLLLAFEGRGAEERAREAVELCGGENLGDELVEHWWEHRNDAVAEYRRLMSGQGLLGPHALVDTMEVAGTWSGLRDLYHRMKDALSPMADIVGCHLSHVYPDGGCLYFTLAAACSDDDSAGRLLTQWWETGMEVCLEYGGALSHHHGIGRVRAPWLRRELDGWHDLLVAVKRAFDPHGIMNPGVLGL